MAKVYKNGVSRNVSEKEARKLKQEKNYIDFDATKVKKELKGKAAKKTAAK